MEQYHKRKCAILLVIIIVAFRCFNVTGQPYVDPLQLRVTSSINYNASSSFSHYYVGSDLPVQLKNQRMLVISPYFEEWKIDTAHKDDAINLQGIALPLTAIVPFNGSPWALAISIITRLNSSELFNKDHAFQIGGAITATYQQTDDLKYKFGIYVNNEFFGLFVVPLAGIDWRINSRNYLFGLLPGKLSYEHQLTTKLYCGATFRSITNSYRLTRKNYMRIDDNQLSVYLDFYVSKHFVISADPGFGLFRQLRSGQERNKIYTGDFSFNDGMFIRLSSSYRIRL